MSGNLASPRARWRHGDPMRAHDALPAPLRRWAAGAALPWSAQSLRRAWRRALAASGGSAEVALARMAAAEAVMLAREAGRVWGPGYPACVPVSPASASSAGTAPARP